MFTNIYLLSWGCIYNVYYAIYRYSSTINLTSAMKLETVILSCYIVILAQTIIGQEPTNRPSNGK